MRIPNRFMDPNHFLMILNENYKKKENEYPLFGISIDLKIYTDNISNDKLNVNNLVLNNGKLIHGVRKDLITLDAHIPNNLLCEQEFDIRFINSAQTWELESVKGDIYIKFLHEEYKRLKGIYRPHPLFIKT